MEKSLDYKGRWRNHTVAFRVSDEEAKLLNDLVALSGLTKQDYITRRLLCQDVVVQGNPRVYKALKNQMTAIHEELKRMESISIILVLISAVSLLKQMALNPCEARDSTSFSPPVMKTISPRRGS